MKRLVKKAENMMYHGTDAENAYQILSSMTIKGSGASAKRMFSLTGDLSTAEAFGSVVFCFQQLTNLTKVVYDDEWFKTHRDIADYVFCNGYAPGACAGMELEDEYIGVGNLTFTDNQLFEIILTDKLDEEEQDEIENQFLSINQNVKISKQ